MTAVTVIIPCKTDGAYLRECLAHLEQQTFRDFDVVVVPDAFFALEGPNVRVIASGPVLPNRKRQIAAAASDAPLIAFIDDDAYPHPGWLANALRHFDDSGIVAAGGPAVTPASDGPLQRASGAIFAAPVVSAGTRCRYVALEARNIDALPSCNLLIRREVFLRDAEASVGFWPGEDILVCWFATRDGARIVYDPKVLVYHHRRNVFEPHLRQVWAYGRFRGYYMRGFGRVHRTPSYTVPAAFALGHLAIPLLLRSRKGRVALAGLAATYAVLAGASAVREARTARANPWLVAAGIYLTHVTYGCASVAGWCAGIRCRHD